MMATSPDAAIRDSVKAEELAREATGLAGSSNPLILRVLAATLADEGDYTEAIETAQMALALVQGQKSAGLAVALQKEIAVYRAGSPVRSGGQTNGAAGRQ